VGIHPFRYSETVSGINDSVRSEAVHGADMSDSVTSKQHIRAKRFGCRDDLAATSYGAGIT
jgi:hypothetical protein